MPLAPLSPNQLIKPKGFELRISLMFAALFVPIAVHLPYFPLWLQAKGFSAEEIAVVLAAPMFLRVVTTPIITALADRANDRANVLIGLTAASLVLSFGYFLPVGYLTVLLVSLALQIVWTAHSPITDSLALSGVRRFGASYPAMRIWGSTSFLLSNFIGGVILAASSPDAVPWMIAVGFLGTLAASLMLPRLGRPRRASPLSASDIGEAAPRLFSRYFLLIVAGVGIINSSHGFLFGFASIYWKSIGIGETVIGLLWAFAVLAEVGVFLGFTAFFGRLSPTKVLMISAVAAAVRWAIYPLIHPVGLGVPGFFVVQSLHAFSTGLFLIGLQKLIAETVPEERTGAAQGIAFFANGFSMATVTLISGPLYESLGANGFYVMAAVALAGLGLVFLAARSAPQRGFGG